MRDAVSEIKDKLNILDVIGPYVELHKAGKSFKGKSPFTAEKTPSFYVSPERGMYYCFSTSQGGDIFTFIQTMEGVDFKGALKLLAEKAGVELTPEAPEKRTERDRAYAALTAAAAFYHDWLAEQSGASDYLTKRGLSPHTIRAWQLGYAPGPPDHGWRHVKEHLESQGYSKAELLRVGLIKQTDGGKEPYDVFRDRLMFPMCDSSGRVVAFSGRVLTPNEHAPKYVNSPETELYKKSELLFGYDKAKQGIRKFDFSLIVEGQFDVVLSHQAGYTNTVAVSGTALTLTHVQQLERLSRRVVLALDADRAGIAAMKRAAELMLGRGFDVKIAEMPEGEDPADMIQADPARFKAVVKDSVHVIEFLLHVMTRTYKDARTRKLRVREEVLPFVLLLPDRIDQDHFISVIAEGIGASVDAVRFEVERLREIAATPSSTLTSVSSDDASSSEAVSDQSAKIADIIGYLTGALGVVPVGYRAAIEAELASLCTLLTVPPTPSADAEARGAFTFEQYTAGMSERSVLDEVAGILNRLRTLIITTELARVRAAQHEAELAGEAEQSLARLSEIQQLEASKRAVPYDGTFFQVQKD